MSNVDSPDKPPLALIAGPTASGKSDLAVRLAKVLESVGRRGVVINADSAQVYADLEVLSARPSVDEMQGVEHRLFGDWDGAQACSAADWAERARVEIELAHEDGAVPILVGGTGLYIRTLLDGIAPVPPVDPQVREAVRDMPLADAAMALQAEDPDRAARLGPADSARIRRALEVVRSSGQPLAHWQQQLSGGIGGAVILHPAILLPDRAWLYERCDRRFAAMLQRGAIAEVEALLARQLSPDLPVMRAIGVPEIADFLRGTAILEDALARGSQSTRNYVKRQITWLRHQPPTDWPRVESEHFNEGNIFASLLRD
ncbi:tRNA (adenosine(37)-N6)-dimethylallyltransferase MiaA [Novosphingobium sp.]|uniref:tRNA (adenosine(37)-N6)-dimethylallyltransferase MiaA n=1 Tax=Novosphingobium sp. TaxID=1874826 RepID=UPI00286DB9F0|nr:tRNA (adenosine(37)-N6)-dimethylallyltransferase MiaA [Novosphingobium sp.]